MDNTAFAAVRHRSPIAVDLLDYARGLSDSHWMAYYNFNATPVPYAFLHRDPLITTLAGKRRFHAGILKMDPRTCYNWHTDTDRMVGLNMLLGDDGESQCLFIDGPPGPVFKTRELVYQPNTYYVFNTQVPHMVLNTSQPRYMFSLEFLDADRGLTFSELCEDLKETSHVS